MNYVLNFGAVLRGFDDLLSGLALGLAMGLAGLVAGSLIGNVAGYAAVFGGRPRSCSLALPSNGTLCSSFTVMFVASP